MKNPQVFIRSDCPRCKGRGTIPRKKSGIIASIPCAKCGGSGYEIRWVDLEDLESVEIVALTERFDALEKKFPFAPRLKKEGE